jgi:hypothetical protein
MSKEEILQGLKAAGLWQRADKDAYWWRTAFDEYNFATGSKLRPTCPGCFKKVKEWLER